MSNNPYGINDPIYDEEIYQELERIIDEIDTEETKYLDKEAERDHLWDEIKRISIEISELKAKQTKRESNTRAKEIDKLSEEWSSRKQQREIIRKELEGAQSERCQMTQIKPKIKKFILSGKYPVHKKVKLPEQKNDTSILFEHPKFTTSTQHTHYTSFFPHLQRIT